METWQASILVVISLLAGAAIPALVQLSMALRALRSATERIGVRADEALKVATSAAQRLDRIGERLEREDRIGSLLDAAGSLARTVNQLQETIKVASAVGAAVGPAVGAAVRAWREGRDGSAPPGGDAEEAGSFTQAQEEMS